MDFLTLAKERYSVRKFADRPIEDEKLEKILRAGHLAPTASNAQPPKSYVVKSAQAMEMMKAVCQFTFGAPVVLLVCYDLDRVWKNPLRAQEQYNTGEVDCSIVTTHMMLEAWEQEIGSCWVAYFDADLVSRTFGLPANIKPVAILPIGYAADDAAAGFKHDMFRPEGEIITEL